MLVQQQQQLQQQRSSCKRGLRLRSILLHSLWITVVGVFLFRLATANTQNVIYVKIFAIAGVALATVPWMIQLLITTALILLYNAGGANLLWIVESRLEEEKLCGEGPVKGRVEEFRFRYAMVLNGEVFTGLKGLKFTTALRCLCEMMVELVHNFKETEPFDPNGVVSMSSCLLSNSYLKRSRRGL